jgi:ABC-type Na+ efflux pump permease subunit
MLLALAFVCAAFAVWSVAHGEMTLLERLFPNDITRVRIRDRHFHGVSLWIMAGAILLFAACFVAAVVSERQTPLGQKPNQSIALTLGMIGFVIAAVMMLLARLGLT